MDLVAIHVAFWSSRLADFEGLKLGNHQPDYICVCEEVIHLKDIYIDIWRNTND